MPDINPTLFRKRRIAVAVAIAVVSLSACSTIPRVEDYDLSRVGEGILKAGSATADISSRVWDRTTYLLGFSDGNEVSDASLLLDEVDLAMMEEDASRPEDTTVLPVTIQNAVPTRLELPGQASSGAALAQATAADRDVDMDVDALLSSDTRDATTIETLAAAANDTDVIGVEDLIHEVTASETLWDISKALTGDATNWHVLADVNNLGPNAAVFPGQQLIIPVDMVRTGYDTPDAGPVEQATAKIRIDLPGTSESGASEPEMTIAAAMPDSTMPATAELTLEPLQEPLEEPVETPSGTPFKLQTGETLWDFARRTTGDATNWQSIALQNQFTERQSVVVRAGQLVYVPEQLVKPELAKAESSPAGITSSSAPASNTGSVPGSTFTSAATATDPVEPLSSTPAATGAADASAVDSAAISATSELLSGAASPLDETQPISIVEATFKSDEQVQPIALKPVVQMTSTSGVPTQIMVSGTYYPKAIYNEADFSSSLLMRVSPGTRLQVSKALGNWYQVETSKGTGYVHQRDIK
jgi:nucleoid-associated protein YgaU